MLTGAEKQIIERCHERRWRVRCARLCAFAFGLSAFFAAQTICRATNLKEYRQRIHEAATALESLHQLTIEAQNAARGVKGARTEARESLPTTESWAFNVVRRSLQPTDRIETPDGEFKADERWLFDALGEYEKLKTSGDAKAETKRADLLAQTADRLRTLEWRVYELEQSYERATKSSDKDAEKGKLNAILHRKEYDEQAEQGGALSRLLERVRNWLRSLFPERKAQPHETASGVSLVGASRVIVYALVLALVGFVLWRFAPFIFKRRARRAKEERGARIILGERIEENQSAIDLLREADALAREGDLRGAIRKAYIALLCELGDRRILRLARHKTNRDYLRETSKRPELYYQMQTLTGNFERHWYGFDEALQTDWAAFRSACEKAIGAK